MARWTSGTASCVATATRSSELTKQLAQMQKRIETTLSEHGKLRRSTAGCWSDSPKPSGSASGSPRRPSPDNSLDMGAPLQRHCWSGRGSIKNGNDVDLLNGERQSGVTALSGCKTQTRNEVDLLNGERQSGVTALSG